MATSYLARYNQAKFLLSAAKVTQLPKDEGVEIAFVGRSNAGKSSAINAITHINKLARTSKTPGCTQLINLFALSPQHRLVDLPGYGYAAVPAEVAQKWWHRLEQYLQLRQCLRGLVLLSDVRHPLTKLDQKLLEFALKNQLPVHVLLTKADKLSKNQARHTLKTLTLTYQNQADLLTLQLFSSLNGEGVVAARKKLHDWFSETAHSVAKKNP